MANGMHMRKKIPTAWSHIDLYSSSPLVSWLNSMESLTTASKILSQLRQLTDEMALTCQDVNILKRGSITWCNPSLEANDDRMLDEITEDSPQLTSRPSKNNNSGSLPKNITSNSQTTSCTEKMDQRDP